MLWRELSGREHELTDKYFEAYMETHIFDAELARYRRVQSGERIRAIHFDLKFLAKYPNYVSNVLNYGVNNLELTIQDPINPTNTTNIHILIEVPLPLSKLHHKIIIYDILHPLHHKHSKNTLQNYRELLLNNLRINNGLTSIEYFFDIQKNYNTYFTKFLPQIEERENRQPNNILNTLREYYTANKLEYATRRAAFEILHRYFNFNRTYIINKIRSLGYANGFAF